MLVTPAITDSRHGTCPDVHLFARKGEHFAHDLSMGQFLRIDKAAYDLLSLNRSMGLHEAARTLARQHNQPAEVLGEVVRELELLKSRGHFGDSVNWLRAEEIESKLSTLQGRAQDKIELCMAESCNLACKYCYCRHCPDKPNQGVMSEEIARKSIDWLFLRSEGKDKLHITLFGGEPLLSKSLFCFVMEYSQQMAQEHGRTISYSMTTNATLLDDDIINYIKRHNFGLMVSLDGPPEIHDAQAPYHSGAGSFDAASKGIRRLMARRRSITVRCTMTNAQPNMRDLIEFFYDFGFSRIVLGRAINPMDSSPVDCGQEAFEAFDRQEEEELLPWMEKQFERDAIPRYFPYRELIVQQHNRQGRPSPGAFKCGACRGTTTVGADGALYPCHRYVGVRAYQIGHIDHGILLDKAKSFWQEYHNALRGVCDACWARLICRGPCPWEISNRDGTFRAPEKWKCGLLRKHFERGAYLHYRLQADYPDLYRRVIGEGL